jgi:hypothetical protein
MDWITDYRT